jgi:hypothetical protein
MKAKRIKHNIPESIIGMSINEARNYCLSEGFVLSIGDKQNIDQTYLVTVSEIDSNGKIIESRYGK